MNMCTCIVFCFVLLSVSHASVRVARDCTSEVNSSEAIEGSEYSSSEGGGFVRCPRGIFDGIHKTISGILRSLRKVGSNLIASLRGGHEKLKNTKSENNNFGNFTFDNTSDGEKGGNSPSDDGSYINSAKNGSGAVGGYNDSAFYNRDPAASDSRIYNSSGRPRAGFSAGEGTSNYTKFEDGEKGGPVGGRGSAGDDSIDNINLKVYKSSSTRDSLDILDTNIRKVFSDMRDTLQSSGSVVGVGGESSIEFGKQNETLMLTKYHNDNDSNSTFNNTVHVGKSGYDGSREYSGDGEGSDSDGELDSNDSLESADSKEHKGSGSEEYSISESGNKGLNFDLFFTGLEGSGVGRDVNGTSIHTKNSNDAENTGPDLEKNGSVGHINSSESGGSVDEFNGIHKMFRAVLGKGYSTAGSIMTEFGRKNETSNYTKLKDGEKGKFVGGDSINNMDSGVHKSGFRVDPGSILDDDLRKVFSDMRDTLQSLGSDVEVSGDSGIKFGKQNETLMLKKYQNDNDGNFTFNSAVDVGKSGHDGSREYSGDGNGEGSDFDGGPDSNDDSLESADTKGHEDSGSEGYAVSGSGNKGPNFDLFFTELEGSGGGRGGDFTGIRIKGSDDEENAESSSDDNGSGGQVNSSNGHDGGQSGVQGHGIGNNSGISFSSGGYDKSHSGGSDGISAFEVSGGDGSNGFISNLGGGLGIISGGYSSRLNGGLTFGDVSDTNGNKGGELSGSVYDNSSPKGVEYGGSDNGSEGGFSTNPASAYGSTLEQGGGFGSKKIVGSGYGRLTGEDSYVKSSSFGCPCLRNGGSGVASYEISGSAPGLRKEGSVNESFKSDSGSVFGDRRDSKKPPPILISKSSGTLDATERYRATSESFGEHEVDDISSITRLFSSSTSSTDASSHVGWDYGSSGGGYKDSGVGKSIGRYNGYESILGKGHEDSSDEDIGFLVEQKNHGLGFGGYQDVGQGGATEDSYAGKSGDSYNGRLSSEGSYGGSRDGNGGGHIIEGSYGGSRDAYGGGPSSKGSYGRRRDDYSGGLNREGSYGGSIDGHGGGLSSGGNYGGSKDDYSGGLSSGGRYRATGDGYGEGLKSEGSYRGSGSGFGCKGKGEKSETGVSRGGVHYGRNIGGKTGEVLGGDSFRLSGFAGGRLEGSSNDGSARVGGYGSTSSYSSSIVINSDASSKTGSYDGTGSFGALNGIGNRVAATQAPSYSRNY